MERNKKIQSYFIPVGENQEETGPGFQLVNRMIVGGVKVQLVQRQSTAEKLSPCSYQ